MKGTLNYGEPTPGVGLSGNVRVPIRPLTYAQSLCLKCGLDDCPASTYVGDGCAKEAAERAAKAIKVFCEGMG